MHRTRDGAAKCASLACGRRRLRCGRLFLHGRCCRHIVLRLDIGGCLKIGLEVRLDDGNLRSVDDLHARALDDDADRARRLEQFFIDDRGVRHGAAQTCRAAVDGGDVALAAECTRNRRTLCIKTCVAARTLTCLVVRLCIELRLLIVVLTARRLEVEVLNHPAEDEVVEEEVDHADGMTYIQLVFASP